MARTANVIGEDALYLGEDKFLDFEVLDADGTPINISSGYTFQFDMRDAVHASVAIISKTCTVTGSYNADRDTNTQRSRATLTDDDTIGFPAGKYPYSHKRTDAGAETINAEGLMQFKEATQK
jgi:hypothetical protein